MKYLVLENKEQETDECLSDIADFLWNNGNEVYISNNYNNKLDYQNFVEYCDWVVLLVYADWSLRSFFEREQGKLQRKFSLEKSNSKKLMLVCRVYFRYDTSLGAIIKYLTFLSATLLIIIIYLVKMIILKET